MARGRGPSKFAPPPDEPIHEIDKAIARERRSRRVASLQHIYADLGGRKEVARALGVSMYQLNRWIDRRLSTNCPLPVAEPSCGTIFSIAEWRAWYAVWITVSEERLATKKRIPVLFNSLTEDDE